MVYIIVSVDWDFDYISCFLNSDEQGIIQVSPRDGEYAMFVRFHGDRILTAYVTG